MAKLKSFVSKKDKERSSVRRRWWTEPKETVAEALTSYCSSLEEAQQRNRYLHMLFEQLATGRAPTSYGIAMHGRVTGDMATALFSPPSENYIAIAVDVFANKVGKNRPALEWVPLTRSDTDLRASCRQATDYTDQVFNDLGAWDLAAQTFKDAAIHGGGHTMVDGWLPDGKKSGGVIELTRIQDDEILLDPTAGASPRNWQFRFFIGRDTAIERFTAGKDEKEAKLIEEALMGAEGCFQGMFGLDVGYDDTLALCMGFYLPSKTGSPGRRVIAIGEVLLSDEEWKDDLPVASLIFEPIADSAKGQGCVEQMLPLQREVDRIADNLAEQERRFAWCKVQIRRGDNIDVDSLTDNSAIEYNEKPALFEQGTAPTKELYNQLATKGQQALARVGISENQAQGETPQGLDAGIAIIARQQIDDIRHVSVGQRQEGYVEQLGKLIIQAAGRYKPDVYSKGKKIEWPEVASDQKKCKARAFPLSGLPQSIPGRKQALADMLRNGEIDKITYRRAVGSSEVRPASDVITASEDFAEFQLDAMMEKGVFQPPIKFQDPQRALTLAQARIMIELKDLPDPGDPMFKKLNHGIQLISQYAAMLVERMDEMAPPPAPAMPGVPQVPGVPQGAEQAPIDAGAPIVTPPPTA